MPICPYCYGERAWSFEEDGKMVTDVCYHCSGTGTISDELWRTDQISGLADLIAWERVSRWRKEEGWEIIASENGMSSFELQQIRTDQEKTKIMAEFAGLSDSLMDSLLRLYQITQVE